MAKLTQDKMRAFLVTLASTGRVDKACEAINVSRYTAYEWRKTNDEFSAAWDEAKLAAASVLEDEAHRRAIDGFEKMTAFGPQITYSDQLLSFLLKANDPNKFADRTNVNHTGAVQVVLATGVPHIADAAFTDVTPQQIEDQTEDDDEFGDLA